MVQSMKKVIYYLSIIMLLATLTPVDSALSISLSELKPDHELNDILFYDRTNSTCSTTFVSTDALEGNDNPSKIYNYLIQKGLNSHQAAGILGNIYVESGFSPTRQEMRPISGKGGWGIVQWTGARRTALVKYISEKDPSLLVYESDTATYGGAGSKSSGYVSPNVPVADNDKLLMIQLDFLYSESTSRLVGGRGNTASHGNISTKFKGKTEWEAIAASGSIRESSDIWLISFERPADQSTSHQETRAKYGADILAEITGNEVTATDHENSTVSNGVGTVSADCRTIQNYEGLEGKILEYVLPDYYPPNHVGASNAMPGYVEAADRAYGEGRYVGGGASPTYADCGGFVTTTMVDSGHDTTYNSSSTGGGGATAVQSQWLANNWDLIGNGGDIDVSQLQIGDVYIRSGHTYMFIGDVPGINSNVASASLGQRVPMAGRENPTDPRGSWYRKRDLVQV